ncbi:hypothetical protein BruAb1_0301 [Brucella abortus bv. 1 str. 9-941]|uniref:Uncharacterized protein n=1 Tax=Brucella abortus biovar 1 (strain 9-941) TaxID=262698 RepID=Q57F80_BRUAB|nr:hypothetical protein BruAb1_0301 [Brucella abortus bv. 1 str. 9-941]
MHYRNLTRPRKSLCAKLPAKKSMRFADPRGFCRVETKIVAFAAMKLVLDAGCRG